MPEASIAIPDGLRPTELIPTALADTTVRLVEFETFTYFAVMIVEPVATVVALPIEPAELLTIAIDVEDELHVTDAVIS